MLEQLRGSAARPFVLHLYTQFFRAGQTAEDSSLDAQLRSYAAAGFQIELVLRYRPDERNAAIDVPAFAAYVRRVVDRYGSSRSSSKVRFIQVTNEANVTGAPAASDGDYPGAIAALIQGMVAAKAESRQRHESQLHIGFNRSDQNNPRARLGFWDYLRRHGAQAFRSSLDWIGVDAYPDTFGTSVSGSLLPRDAAATLVRSLLMLRRRYLSRAGIVSATPLHVSENGYPTGEGRSYRQQAAVLRSEVEEVSSYRIAFNVTDYRWFDRRDADSSEPSIEGHYGLMRDDYSRKPAFAIYRSLIAALGRRSPDRPHLA